MSSKQLYSSFKSDIYDLDEPPHTFHSSPATVVSYGGMVLKKEVAAYVSLLFKLKIGENMSPDVKYYLSRYTSNMTGRLTIRSKDRSVSNSATDDNFSSYKEESGIYDKDYQDDECCDGGGHYDPDGRAL